MAPSALTRCDIARLVFRVMAVGVLVGCGASWLVKHSQHTENNAVGYVAIAAIAYLAIDCGHFFYSRYH